MKEDGGILERGWLTFCRVKVSFEPVEVSFGDDASEWVWFPWAIGVKRFISRGQVNNTDFCQAAREESERTSALCLHFLAFFYKRFLDAFGDEHVVWSDACLARIDKFPPKDSTRCKFQIRRGVNEDRWLSAKLIYDIEGEKRKYNNV